VSIPNTSAGPTVWTETELAEQAQISLNAFVDRRLAEPSGKYAAHLEAHNTTIGLLFKTMAKIDPANPDPHAVRAVLLDDKLFDALRYVTGPPVSQDDLGVLVTRSIARLGKTAIRQSEKTSAEVLALICKLADPFRFPWIVQRRQATRRELRESIGATAILQATQSLQTERRSYGKVVEKRLEIRLTELGFKRAQTPSKARITAPMHYPKYPDFYGECTVHGRKVDLLIALPTGRMIALEAKDSSSALNSVKRLNNDTAAKAKHFAAEGGKNIVNVALLSGVFKVESLISAQQAGLYLVWSHDLDRFIAWIKSQT
jgi:XamI restriction endonuclease